MKKITLLLLLPLFAFAIVPQQTPECKALYEDSKSQWLRLEPVLKTKIASKVGWDLIHKYLNLGTKTISECEDTRHLDFRSIREIKQNMKRADKLRDTFWTQTYNSMVAKARREGKCTNIYNSYGTSR